MRTDNERACEWLEANGHGAVEHCVARSGGDTCDSWELTLVSGTRVFLKTHAAPPASFNTTPSLRRPRACTNITSTRVHLGWSSGFSPATRWHWFRMQAHLLFRIQEVNSSLQPMRLGFESNRYRAPVLP